MPDADRAALVAMIRGLAAAEPDDGWRQFILRAPYAIGLAEDESLPVR